MLGVEDLVPESVKLVNVVMVLQREEIRTFVTGSEFRRVEVLTVEGLDQVSDVVDEEAKCKRLCDILVVGELVHEVSVHVAGLVGVTLLA